MNRITSLIFVILFILCSVPAYAGDENGGSAGVFMQIPVGGRPGSMGNAYIAISNDAAGPLYNPAGLANLSRPLFGSSYRVMQLDRKVGYATVIFPARLNSIIGFNWLYAGSGNVDGRNADGDLTGSEYSMNNHNIGFVFAKRFMDGIAAGVKLSYLQSTLGDLTSFTVSFDFGFMVYLSQFIDREKRDLVPIQDIQLGIVLRNFAANYRWDTSDFGTTSIGTIQEDKVPFEGGLGLSARFLDRKLLVAVDGLYHEVQKMRLNMGAEFFVKPEFALRTGFSDFKFTAGTGYVFKLGDNLLAIDYAFNADKIDLGSEHLFSFDLLF